MTMSGTKTETSNLRKELRTEIKISNIRKDPRRTINLVT